MVRASLVLLLSACGPLLPPPAPAPHLTHQLELTPAPGPSCGPGHLDLIASAPDAGLYTDILDGFYVHADGGVEPMPAPEDPPSAFIRLTDLPSGDSRLEADTTDTTIRFRIGFNVHWPEDGGEHVEPQTVRTFCVMPQRL